MTGLFSVVNFSWKNLPLFIFCHHPRNLEAHKCATLKASKSGPAWLAIQFNLCTNFQRQSLSAQSCHEDTGHFEIPCPSLTNRGDSLNASQDDQMAEVGEALWRSSSPAPLLTAGELKPVAGTAFLLWVNKSTYMLCMWIVLLGHEVEQEFELKTSRYYICLIDWRNMRKKPATGRESENVSWIIWGGKRSWKRELFSAVFPSLSVLQASQLRKI